MNEKATPDSQTPPTNDIRREAERRLHDKKGKPAEAMAEVDVRATVHELQVHQIELEMQNEELLRAQTALQQVSDNYRDLFDFAPVGYFRLDEGSRILELNLAGAALLGLDRSKAINQGFGTFVAPGARVRFAQFVNDVLAADCRQICEIELQMNEKLACVILEGIAARECQGNRSLRPTASDITDRKQAESRLAADLAALTRMHELSRRTLAAGGLASLLQEIMDAAVVILRAERGTLQLLEDGSLRIVAHHGHQQAFLEFFAGAGNQASACGEAWKSGERVIIPDVEGSSLLVDTPSLAVLRTAGVRAVQSTPVVSRTGTLLGVLSTHWGIPHCPDEHDLWRLDLLIRQAGDLIESVRTQEAIKAALAEKEVLLKEVLHRVKNNMQVLSSLVSLQAKSMTDPAVLAALADVRDRIRSMGLVHEKLYQSSSLAEVDFAAYAESLLQALWRSNAAPQSAVQLKMALAPVKLSAEAAVPCGLILNELVTNAFKHAFRGRSDGRVTVATSTGPDGRVSLRVSDNGVGLPENFDWREAKSLGLQLVQMLAKQLGGTVEACAPTGGTEFEVAFGGGGAKT